MSETAKEYRDRQLRELAQARASAMRMATAHVLSGCKTEDERYERIRDSISHDMIWRMTHVPQ